MRDDGFHYSKSNFLRKVSLEDFRDVVNIARKAIAKTHRSVIVEVETAETIESYNYQKTNHLCDGFEYKVHNGELYDLDQLTKEVWERSLDITVTIKDMEGSLPFRIWVFCDRCEEARRIYLYGQCLDSATRKHLVDAFEIKSLAE